MSNVTTDMHLAVRHWAVYPENRADRRPAAASDHGGWRGSADGPAVE